MAGVLQMTGMLQVYKCEKCGNIVEMLVPGRGEMYCCGELMKLMPEQTADATKEKHVPIIEKIEGGYKVKVGSVPHPMLENHWITWIQLIAGDKVYQEFLKPGMAPEATFYTDAEEVYAREFCNIHGLWKGEK